MDLHVKRYRATNAFTFVEVLLVITLMTVIAIAIYNGIANGIKVWNKAYQVVKEEDVLVFFEKITRDLRNAASFSQINLKGTRSSISFATIVRTPADPKTEARGEYIDQIGKVEYAFDKLRQQVVRRQGNYSEALRNSFGKEDLLMEHVSAVEFRYLYKTQKGYEWKDKIEIVIPSSVYVAIEFGGKRNKRKMSKMINLPVGT